MKTKLKELRTAITYIKNMALTDAEIEAMEGELFLPAFRRLRFVDVNRPFWRRLLYRAFAASKKKCDRWHDYEMHVRPQAAGEPIYYEFTACPTADFAKKFGLLEVLPALCNVDYTGMALIRAKLVRTTTCGDRHPYPRQHPEYVDEAGYRRNR